MTPPINDSLTKYGAVFQTKIITCLLVDQEFAVRISDLIFPELFDSESKQWLTKSIKDYYYEYKVTPTLAALKIKINEINQPLLNGAVVDELREVTKHLEATDLEFVKTETTTFCKNQKLKSAIVRSVDLLQLGKYEEIKRVIDDAMRAGASRDIGLNYVKEFDTILDEINRPTVSTGWDAIDNVMDGGLAGGELGIVVAPAGIGKSWFLQALGVKALMAGKNVMHYTLELNQAYVGMRYATIFSEVAVPNIKEHKVKVKEIITRDCLGELLIKYFPTRAAGVETLHTHLKTAELLGHSPDVIIVDYADLLSDNSKANSGEIRHQLGNIYEDLRGMSGEFQIPVWTASQSNRSSLEDDIIGAEKIAESYAKIMTADFVMSLSRKVEDKIGNTGRFHVIKNRFGPDGITFPAKVNTNTGKMEIYEGNSVGGKEQQGKIDNRDNLMKKMLSNRYEDLMSDE